MLLPASSDILIFQSSQSAPDKSALTRYTASARSCPSATRCGAFSKGFVELGMAEMRRVTARGNFLLQEPARGTQSHPRSRSPERRRDRGRLARILPSHHKCFLRTRTSAIPAGFVISQQPRINHHRKTFNHGTHRTHRTRGRKATADVVFCVFRG